MPRDQSLCIEINNLDRTSFYRITWVHDVIRAFGVDEDPRHIELPDYSNDYEGNFFVGNAISLLWIPKSQHRTNKDFYWSYSFVVLDGHNLWIFPLHSAFWGGGFPLVLLQLWRRYWGTFPILPPCSLVSFMQSWPSSEIYHLKIPLYPTCPPWHTQLDGDYWSSLRFHLSTWCIVFVRP